MLLGSDLRASHTMPSRVLTASTPGPVDHRCYAREMTLVRWSLAVSLAALALGCFSPCPQSRATLAHPTMTTDPVEIGMGARVRP